MTSHLPGKHFELELPALDDHHDAECACTAAEQAEHQKYLDQSLDCLLERSHRRWVGRLRAHAAGRGPVSSP